MTLTEIYTQPKLASKVGTSAALAIPDEWRMWGRLAMVAKAVTELGMSHGAVVDLGCGYGDLSVMLPNADYTGLEMHEHILNEAKRRYPTKRFMQGKIDDLGVMGQFPHRDVTVAAGILATVSPKDMPYFIPYLREWTDRYLIVTWLDPIHYGGKLHPYTLREIIGYMGDDFRYLAPVSRVPGDEGQTGGMFARVA